MADDSMKHEVGAKLIAHAWSDPEFRRRLIAEPHVVLREHGIQTRDDVTYKVIEDTATVRHLVIPHSRGATLSEADLKKSPIAANFTCA